MRSAADELNTVQSNVTVRSRALEQELGIVLFDRHSRGVTVTAAGRTPGRTSKIRTAPAQTTRPVRGSRVRTATPAGAGRVVVVLVVVIGRVRRGQ